MSLDRLSKADIKTIMELNELTAQWAWNIGHRMGDDGAERSTNPFKAGSGASTQLLELMTKALGK